MPEKIITIDGNGFWKWRIGKYERVARCYKNPQNECGDWCPHFSVEQYGYQELGKPGATIERYIKLTCGSDRTIPGTIIDERFKE